MLTHQQARDIFNYDSETGKLYWKQRIHKRIRIGLEAGRLCKHGYRKVTAFGKEYYTHRLVWFIVTGNWPRHEIDHINRVRDDNKFENLREVTSSQNKQNTSRTCVRKNSNCSTYSSTININGVRHYLGSYKTKEEALAAYLTAKKELHPYASIHD